MMNITILSLLLIFSFSFTAHGQYGVISEKKNNIFLQANHHFERRGTEKYFCSNPDFAIGYERQLVQFGSFAALPGIRTGVYREYVLTGYGWEHPEKTRFFLGTSVSCMYDPGTRAKIQITLLTDVLLPDDYDEIWSYWAVEPSVYFIVSRNIYTCLTATMGSFLFFDPKAYMDKAGIRAGIFF